MGAVMSLNKKTYLSLCVFSTNVITIWFSGAKRSHSKQSLHSLKYSTDFFFFVFHGIKKQFLAGQSFWKQIKRNYGSRKVPLGRYHQNNCCRQEASMKYQH